MSKSVLTPTINPAAAGDKSLMGHPQAFTAMLESDRTVINVRLVAGPLPAAMRAQASDLLLPSATRAVELTRKLPELAAVEAAAQRRREAEKLQGDLKGRQDAERARIENPANWTGADGLEQLLRAEEQLAALGRQVERQARVVADLEGKERAAQASYTTAAQAVHAREFAADRAALVERRRQTLARLEAAAAPLLEELLVIGLGLGPDYVNDRVRPAATPAA